MMHNKMTSELNSGRKSSPAFPATQAIIRIRCKYNLRRIECGIRLKGLLLFRLLQPHFETMLIKQGRE